MSKKEIIVRTLMCPVLIYLLLLTEYVLFKEAPTFSTVNTAVVISVILGLLVRFPDKKQNTKTD